MKTSLILKTIAAASAVSCAVPAGAQPAAPGMHAPLRPEHASGVSGDVSAEPQGAGTRVNVTFSGRVLPRHQALTLMSGAECTDRLSRSAKRIALNPVHGRVSSTLVAIPFSAFRSQSFVVDVREATAAASQSEACGRI
jgi:hypothetical protein